AVEARGHPERVLAADRDERVEAPVADVPQHLLDAAVELERVRAARADDRPAARQDPGHLLRAEVAEVPVHEAAPALEDRDAVPAFGVGCADDGAEHCVQPRAVAAAGEHSERFCHAPVSLTNLPQPGHDERPVSDDDVADALRHLRLTDRSMTNATAVDARAAQEPL